MINEALILAGGLGTRLQSVITDIPKPMAPINGEPFLNFQLRYLKYYGIKKIIFSVSYLRDSIFNYYGSNFNGLEIEYSIEEQPLGTGGGIRQAINYSSEKNILVLNGDSFFDIDLHSFSNHHLSFDSDCSLALRTVEDSSRYGTIQLTEANGGRGRKIVAFAEKSESSKNSLINGGIYILNKESYLKNTPENLNFSLEKDFFETKVNSLNMYGVEFDGYFIDIGVPYDYLKAQNDFKKFKYK